MPHCHWFFQRLLETRTFLLELCRRYITSPDMFIVFQKFHDSGIVLYIQKTKAVIVRFRSCHNEYSESGAKQGF